MAHEDIGVEVHRRRAEVGQALHDLGQGQHLGAVGGEVQVRAADATGLDPHQGLTGAGTGVGEVVADHDLAVAQRGGPHQASASFSSTWSVMALSIAWPARPNSSCRFAVAQSCEARGAASWFWKCGTTSRAKRR